MLRKIAFAITGVGLAGMARGAGIGNTLFLDHFDGNVGQAPGAADFAAGDPNPQIGPPIGPGGEIVSSPARFGDALNRANGVNVGGRLEFNLQDNFSLAQGTIDMWVNSSSLTSTGFRSLWGTENSVGPGDIRMYVYDSGGQRTLGAYMIDGGGTATHWETEAAIPAGQATNDVWHHVAWEWDLAAHQSNLYWDGQKIGAGATNGQTIRFNGSFDPSLFHIGESQLGSAPWLGYMDEFRISDVMRYNGASFVPPTAPYEVATNWNVDNGGNWTVIGNWSGGVPNALGVTARFGSVITAPHTVSVNSPITVSAVAFDNANSYTLSGGTLTIDVNRGNGSISVASGTHTIAAALVLADDTNVNVLSATAALNTSNLQPTSAVLAKDGPGKWTVNALRATALAVNAGTVAVLSNGTASGASRLVALGLAGGATPTGTLDLNDNDLVDLTTGKSTIEAQLKYARNGGAWNRPGITSSAARNVSTTGLGVLSGAEYNSVGGTGTFSGISYGSGDTLVKYTWNGDANLDGRVTFDDYVKIDTGFNTQLTGWLNGDFNYSGNVSFDDYVLIDIAFNQQNGTLSRAIDWMSGEDRSSAGLDQPGVAEVLEHFGQFGPGYGSAFLAAVPEPTAGIVFPAMSLAALGKSRRLRRPSQHN